MEIQQMLLDQQFSSLFGLELHPTAEAISRPQPLSLLRRRAKLPNTQDSQWTATAPSTLEVLSQLDFIHGDNKAQ